MLRLILSDKLPPQLTDVLISQYLDQDEHFVQRFELIQAKLTVKHFSKLSSKNFDSVTRFFLHRINSLPKDFVIPLSSSSKFTFDVAEKLLNFSRKDIKILLKSGFIDVHPEFLLPLFSVIYSNNQIARITKENNEDKEHFEKLSSVFKDIQKRKFSSERDEAKDFDFIFGWFNWIASDEKKVEILLRRWIEWLESEVQKKPNFQSLVVLFTLFHYIKKEHLDDFLKILNHSCTEEFVSSLFY